MPERSSKSRCPCNCFLCCNKQVKECGCWSHMNLGRMESSLGICVMDFFYVLDVSSASDKVKSESVQPSVVTTEKPPENVTIADGRSICMVELTI